MVVCIRSYALVYPGLHTVPGSLGSYGGYLDSSMTSTTLNLGNNGTIVEFMQGF